MAVDAKWGRFHTLSRNVPFCPRLSSFVLFWGPEQGQIGTHLGQIGKRPHLGSTPV